MAVLADQNWFANGAEWGCDVGYHVCRIIPCQNDIIFYVVVMSNQVNGIVIDYVTI